MCGSEEQARGQDAPLPWNPWQLSTFCLSDIPTCSRSCQNRWAAMVRIVRQTLPLSKSTVEGWQRCHHVGQARDQRPVFRILPASRQTVWRGINNTGTGKQSTRGGKLQRESESPPRKDAGSLHPRRSSNIRKKIKLIFDDMRRNSVSQHFFYFKLFDNS